MTKDVALLSETSDRKKPTWVILEGSEKLPILSFNLEDLLVKKTTIVSDDVDANCVASSLTKCVDVTVPPTQLDWQVMSAACSAGISQCSAAKMEAKWKTKEAAADFNFCETIKQMYNFYCYCHTIN